MSFGQSPKSPLQYCWGWAQLSCTESVQPQKSEEREQWCQNNWLFKCSAHRRLVKATLNLLMSMTAITAWVAIVWTDQRLQTPMPRSSWWYLWCQRKCALDQRWSHLSGSHDHLIQQTSCPWNNMSVFQAPAKVHIQDIGFTVLPGSQTPQNTPRRRAWEM